MVEYVVQTGDTLFIIARNFGTTMESIIKLNNLENPDMIFPGQVLKVEPGAGAAGTEASRIIDGLLYVLQTDKTDYLRGEPVNITLKKVNRTGRSLTLRYPTAQRFDFTVRREAGQLTVWRWSRGQTFGEATGTVTLAPGDSQVFKVTWDQTNDRGQQVSPGNFIVQGFNAAEGLAGRAVSTVIRVRRAAGPAPPQPPAPGENLLRNPGFETWVDESKPVAWDSINVSRTALSRTGSYAAEMGALTYDRAILTQTVDIEAGRIYDLSFWARENTQPDGIARYVLFVEIFYYNRAGQFVGRTEPRFSQENIPDKQYIRFSMSTGSVPAGADRAEVKFTFEPAGSNTSMVKIDDVELKLFR